MLALLRRVRKDIRIRSHRVVAPPQWLEIGKKTPPQITFNNTRSSIKLGSTPDPHNITIVLNMSFHFFLL